MTKNFLQVVFIGWYFHLKVLSEREEGSGRMVILLVKFKNKAAISANPDISTNLQGTERDNVSS